MGVWCVCATTKTSRVMIHERKEDSSVQHHSASIGSDFESLTTGSLLDIYNLEKKFPGNN